MPISEFLKNKPEIKKLNNKKDKIISIGGGEPTIYPDFFRLIELVDSFADKVSGKEILLLTNARAFSKKEFLQKFNSLNLDKKRLRIAAAIYSHDKKIHESVTRTPESFDQTTAGIKNLIRSGYKIEFRVILSKLNYRSAVEMAEYIVDNFPEVERVAFIAMKFTGEAEKNKQLLALPFKKLVKEIIPAVDKLENNHIKTMLLHFPYCILPETYWRYTMGKTIPDDQIMFKDECKMCTQFKTCSGIWKSYAEFMPLSEFNPIK